MATIFNDTFTESSNTQLQSHTPDTGTSWTKLWGGSPSGNLTVYASSDTVKGTSGTATNTGTIYTADATYSSADYDVSLDVVAGFTGTNPGYILARVADQENMYALYFTTGATNTQLYKKVSGTWSSIGTAVADPATSDTVKLRVEGSTLTFYYNDVQKGSETDTDISAAGEAGFAMGGGGELVNSGDDMLATSEIDNFNASTIDSGVNITVQEATHSHTADQPAITQTHVVTAQEATHAHAADNVTVTVNAVEITVQGSTHSHTVDSPAITQTHIISVTESTHSHTADNVTVGVDVVVNIDVAATAHAHATDEPAITQTHVINSSGASHSQTAAQPAITQTHVIVVGDATHSHTADVGDFTDLYVTATAAASGVYTTDTGAASGTFTTSNAAETGTYTTDTSYDNN